MLTAASAGSYALRRHWLDLLTSAARQAYGDCTHIPPDLDDVIREHASFIIGFGL